MKFCKSGGGKIYFNIANCGNLHVRAIFISLLSRLCYNFGKVFYSIGCLFDLSIMELYMECEISLPGSEINPQSILKI